MNSRHAESPLFSQGIVWCTEELISIHDGFSVSFADPGILGCLTPVRGQSSTATSSQSASPDNQGSQPERSPE